MASAFLNLSLLITKSRIDCNGLEKLLKLYFKVFLYSENKKQYDNYHVPKKIRLHKCIGNPVTWDYKKKKGPDCTYPENTITCTPAFIAALQQLGQGSNLDVHQQMNG